jgi:hypothetical protein
MRYGYDSRIGEAAERVVRSNGWMLRISQFAPGQTLAEDTYESCEFIRH